MAEPTDTKAPSTKWWVGMLNIQTLIWIGAGIVSIVLFVAKVNSDDAAIKEIRADILRKADENDLKTLEDRVTRQYQRQSEHDAKQDAESEKALDWIEFEKGRQAGIKEVEHH
jgi:hypothetical protein